MSKNILVIQNPNAGRGITEKLRPKLEKLLNQRNFDFRFELTNAPKHAIEIAKSNLENGFDSIVAFGGDGTVHEVVNGLAGSNVAFGVIPCGTGNDYARAIGVKSSMEKAVQCIAECEPEPIDLGKINERYFINAVGIGFDGVATEESAKITKVKGPLVYLIAIVKTLKKFKSIELEIEMNGTKKTMDTFLFEISKGPSVGGGLALNPDAKQDSGEFRICHLAPMSIPALLKDFPKLKNGKIDKAKTVTRFRAKNLTVKCEIPMPIHIDGEYVEEKELRFEILPKSFRVHRFA